MNLVFHTKLTKSTKTTKIVLRIGVIRVIRGSTLARTTNRGSTWTTIVNPVPAEKLYSIVVRTPLLYPFVPRMIFLGTSNGVYLSTNDGATWTKKNGNLPNVKVVQLHYDSGYVYAVTFGRGLWRIPFYDL